MKKQTMHNALKFAILLMAIGINNIHLHKLKIITKN